MMYFNDGDDALIVNGSIGSWGDSTLEKYNVGADMGDGNDLVYIGAAGSNSLYQNKETGLYSWTDDGNSTQVNINGNDAGYGGDNKSGGQMVGAEIYLGAGDDVLAVEGRKDNTNWESAAIAHSEVYLGTGHDQILIGNGNDWRGMIYESQIYGDGGKKEITTQAIQKSTIKLAGEGDDILTVEYGTEGGTYGSYDNTIDLGAGYDTVIFTGNNSSYKLTSAGNNQSGLSNTAMSVEEVQLNGTGQKLSVSLSDLVDSNNQSVVDGGILRINTNGTGNSVTLSSDFTATDKTVTENDNTYKVYSVNGHSELQVYVENTLI
ncbi:hypothetical protein [Lonepinella sp. BR2271]|uniref:hypothetical protein n=1 Tax=Lonepinella sp. BR2271 TaxID=3434550 RepID=UPI003F6DD9FF